MSRGLLQTLAPHMIVGLEGPRLSDEEKGLLSRYPFPGVILFERNVADSRQLMDLAQGLRNVFRAARGAVPLVAADHEGGAISVLGRAIGAPPTQAAAARAGDERLVERLFAENARRMRACGVNWLLGPVADVNSDPLNPVIGTRSFGEDTAAVSPLVSAAVAVSRREGVLTCLKHFPGHGPTCVDSHLELATLGATLEQLRERDMPPFASGIAAGAEAVMMGHIAPLGRPLPASLDPEIIGGVLRGELGFGGAVVTDALEMEGVKVAGLREICARALAAGNDMLLFSKPVGAVAAELEAAGAAGESSAADDPFAGLSLEASAARISRLVESAAAREREFDLPGDAGIYREIAQKSVAVRRGGGTAPAGDAPAIDPARGASAVFWAEKGEFDRYPAQSFIARTLRALGIVEDARLRPLAEERTGRYTAETRVPPPSAAHLQGWAFSPVPQPPAPLEIVFLLNRRPLAEEAVKDLCAGAGTIVIAGWPRAKLYVPEGRTVATTFGVYDAAADFVCREIG
jgi:beta-N-acetylhexosaminidase